MISPVVDEPVEIFGPYEVYERLGIGGMASVHRAKKHGIEGFQRVVALKRLLAQHASNERFIRSFVREARLASQLQHPNITQIYDLGRVDGVYYIAMELVAGYDLRQILRQTAYATGPMPVPMMAVFTQQICDALEYAHNLTSEDGEPLGLVHRDISPSNLLIATGGHLKVIDFGVAKATASALQTFSGRIKGKWGYMAPEALRSAELDRRSDVFSLGVVTYEMLTARPLFVGRSQFETMDNVAKMKVDPPSRYNANCPPELDEIVLTALAKSPDERWQSTAAMARALEQVVKQYSLQTSNREISEWVAWAFAQPLSPGVQAPPVIIYPSAQHKQALPQPVLTTKHGARTVSVATELTAREQASIDVAWNVQPHAEDESSTVTEVPARALAPAGVLAHAKADATTQHHMVPTVAPLAGASPADKAAKSTLLGLGPSPELQALRDKYRASSQPAVSQPAMASPSDSNGMPATLVSLPPAAEPARVEPIAAKPVSPELYTPEEQDAEDSGRMSMAAVLVAIGLAGAVLIALVYFFLLSR